MATRSDDEADEADEERENSGPPPTVGLWVVRARDVPISLILRRGPTRHVRMVRWDMRRDDFQRGQWLVGQVEVLSTEVSPGGTYVHYVGMKKGNGFRAIAKVPYFTPLAVWDGPHTGGWVSTTGAALPAWLKNEWPTWPGARARDRWLPVDEEGPYPVHRPHPTMSGFELRRRDARGVGGYRLSDRHSYDYRVIDRRGDVEHDLGTADWADWHPSGDLAVAREGVISRLPIVKRALGEPVVIVDFHGEPFEKMPPPPDALTWLPDNGQARTRRT